MAEEALTGGCDDSSTPAAHSIVNVPAATTATAPAPRRAINVAAAATAKYPAFAVDRDAVLDNAYASASTSSAPASASSPTTPWDDRPANLPPVAAVQERRANTEPDTVRHDAALKGPSASPSATPSPGRRANLLAALGPARGSRERPPQQQSDVNLLKYILWPWVATGATKAGEAHVVDICSAGPDEFARRYQPVSEQGERVWYFLSRLRPKGTSGGWQHKERAVLGVGSWHAEAAPKNVVDPLDDGRLLGYSQKLSFLRKGADGGRGGVRTGWVINEFHLHKYDEEGGAGTKIEGRVLCKMYQSNRHRDPRSGAAQKCGGETEDGGGETAGKALRGRKRVGAVPPARAPKRVAAAAAYDERFDTPDYDERFDTPASWLHCPQCGFHLGAVQAIVTPICQSEAANPPAD